MGPDYDLDELYANTYTEEDRLAHRNRPISGKRFVIAWAAAVVGGLVGAQRWYLGLFATAAVKTLLFGLALMLFAVDQIGPALAAMSITGAWTIIDLFLLLSGTMRDRRDHELAGYERWAGPCAAVTVLLFAGMLVVALVMGTSSGVAGS
ncbi:TM2 domain-containing protein [Nesterenkonia sp. NBAIMH1]|uniref:TM2 domain-containing protein n=1 Tax=Nesterenkonia sp. NBAIMH1 TaxID=2600320 RepID=UPI0011B6DC8E|nr:TM2 domain-containing protein [Nesterenkonia sp. NBAIMH1]